MPPENKDIIVLIPTITRKKFRVIDFHIEKFATATMMCNGCGKDIEPLNSKGVFETKDGWFRLCYECCLKQGFIK